MIDFNAITYDFFKDEYPCNQYGLDELVIQDKRNVDKSTSTYREWDMAKKKFLTARDDLQKDFKDICRLFGVEFYIEELKKGGRYEFDERDLNFIVEILRRYRTLPIWKKVLKQIQAYEYDRFRKVFQAMDYSEDLGREIRYTVDGFIRLYTRANKDQSRNKEFENTIRVSTQYDWICVVFELTSILRGIHPIKMRDIEKSISGVLLEDYYDWVKRLRVDMLNLLAIKDMEWIMIVNQREKEYMEMLQHCSDEIDEFIGELQERINNRLVQEIKDIEAKRKYEENIRKRTKESLRAQIVREEIIKVAKENPALAKEAFKRLIPKSIDELFD